MQHRSTRTTEFWNGATYVAVAALLALAIMICIDMALRGPY
jgi:hypothetical protein